MQGNAGFVEVHKWQQRKQICLLMGQFHIYHSLFSSDTVATHGRQDSNPEFEHSLCDCRLQKNRSSDVRDESTMYVGIPIYCIYARNIRQLYSMGIVEDFVTLRNDKCNHTIGVEHIKCDFYIFPGFQNCDAVFLEAYGNGSIEIQCCQLSLK